ncbi:response regulator [Pseudoalteromonas sp. YIC-656]|uniref:ATP-binding response regulator n=1 Tax=Pseudoalteromonas pernae TaxID=3118054 RepID=UPI003241C3EA
MHEIISNSIKDTSFQQLTVLVVDSIDNMRVTVAKMLHAMCFGEVLQASNGADALNLIKKQHIDLVITELKLPKLDGIELLKAIRADESSALIPVVFMSAVIEQQEVIAAIKHGASEYVVKPFSGKILAERLVRALEKPVKKFRSKQQSTIKDKPTEETAEPIHILVVDDVADNIQVISEILRKDYKIKAAISGEKALAICNAQVQPDLVLLDIMMPTMDGLEVCRRLKENPNTQHIAIIFLSALDQNKDVITGLELGAVDYITKPVNPLVVKARIAAHTHTLLSTRMMRNQIDTFIENQRLRDEFERIMQNDLKHPLNEMVKTLELLERYHKDADKVKSSTAAIKQSTTSLSHMIDNMLTLSQLEDGSYHLCPVPLNLLRLVTAVLDNYRLSANDKHLEIQNEIAPSTQIKAEELLTMSLLSNLIQNAIDAAPRGSAINLSATRNGMYMLINIHNHGAVAEEVVNCFFDKYVSYGKRNAAGIGTYAAKLMTEVQNGSISFDTHIEHGTTLSVSLPCD